MTIGIGRNLDDVGITEGEARTLLRGDISRVLGELETQQWFHPLTGARRRAIANMCFNLGLNGLLQFRRMIAAIQSEDWEEASAQLLNSLYARQVGARADRLAEMLRSG
nr:glycoside hydrolase family protein [Microbulbifer celer]